MLLPFLLRGVSTRGKRKRGDPDRKTHTFPLDHATPSHQNPREPARAERAVRCEPACECRGQETKACDGEVGRAAAAACRHARASWCQPLWRRSSLLLEWASGGEGARWQAVVVMRWLDRWSVVGRIGKSRRTRLRAPEQSVSWHCAISGGLFVGSGAPTVFAEVDVFLRAAKSQET